MDIFNKTYEVLSRNWQDHCFITETEVKRLANNDQARILFEQNGKLAIYWPNWESLEYLLYNEAGNNFFLLDNMHFLHTCNGNANLYICFCSSKKFIGYVIPKNGCTSLLSTALKYDHEIISHNPWGDGNAGKVTFYQDSYHALKYKDYVHFAVYRDPVERFVNYCNYTYTRCPFLVSPYATPEMSKGEFIQTLILMAKIIAPFGRGEAHLQTQMHYMRDTTRIDYLVYLKDFSRFQMEILHLDEPVQANKSHKEHTITIEDLTPGQIEQVREIYKEDYLIPQLYEDRIYVPAY